MTDGRGCRDGVIGVDFDNTIVSYDELFLRLASERGLIDAGQARGKKSIRDAVRALPGGETEWQRLQGIAYGARMGEARLIDGVAGFFRACRARGRRVCIVSHKTEYATLDETRTNLREVALAWMARQGFFESSGLGLRADDVWFEGTREGKIERIRLLVCSHFIDDLEETFLEPSFPATVGQILFAAHGGSHALPHARSFATWNEIQAYLLR